LPAIGGAMRAAARLREDTQLTSLQTAGDREAERAAQPFESARFLLHAGEAWATVGDVAFACRRYEDARAMAAEHGFFEIEHKAEAGLAALRNAPDFLNVAGARTVTWENRSASTVADADAEALVAAGIGRLEALRD
jgi:hypothetical protein